MDTHADGLAIKRRVGYLPGELPEFPGARARHVLDLLSGLRGGPPRSESISAVSAAPAGTGSRVFTRWLLRSACSALVVRGRYGLLAWSGAAAMFTGLLMLLEPSVIDVWSWAERLPSWSRCSGAHSPSL
jgi:hypothetical protein